jgi:hypothetical protein
VGEKFCGFIGSAMNLLAEINSKAPLNGMVIGEAHCIVWSNHLMIVDLAIPSKILKGKGRD